ncbi:MAG TPA: ribbon-helix-helix protein, CopG family [Chloroflexi bacterium]|nr:ribbon-helix-helix protein, CopG family [Chloroflexota bacterium]
MPEGFVQVNVNITDEDARQLDAMMIEDAYDNRSAFVRRLIRQEYARRYSQPNPAITVEDAEKAAQNSK